jgi:predicted acyltransferase
MVVFGVNAITAFVASGMLTKALLRIRVGEGEGVSLYQAIYESGFRSWAGELNGSLAFALAYVLLWWMLMSILQRRGVTLKV